MRAERPAPRPLRGWVGAPPAPDPRPRGPVPPPGNGGGGDGVCFYASRSPGPGPWACRCPRGAGLHSRHPQPAHSHPRQQMQGQLFSQDFLTRGVLATPPCQAFDDLACAAFTAALRSIYQSAGLDAGVTINEAQTESLVIDKVLAALGWGDDFLPQANLSGKRRQDVPDYLLFADGAQKTAALGQRQDELRYRHGLVILEAKSWLRPLDPGEIPQPSHPDAPSSQMLRFLSRAELVSERAVQWGMLTNGNVWRLYWQGARSRSEEFFEVDVAAALGLPGIEPESDEIAPAHALRLFFLFFQRSAFLPQSWDSAHRSWHAYALNEARLYEEKVAQDLGARVFADIFAQLADAL